MIFKKYLYPFMIVFALIIVMCIVLMFFDYLNTGTMIAILAPVTLICIFCPSIFSNTYFNKLYKKFKIDCDIESFYKAIKPAVEKQQGNISIKLIKKINLNFAHYYKGEFGYLLPDLMNTYTQVNSISNYQVNIYHKISIIIILSETYKILNNIEQLAFFNNEMKLKVNEAKALLKVQSERSEKTFKAYSNNIEFNDIYIDLYNNGYVQDKVDRLITLNEEAAARNGNLSRLEGYYSLRQIYSRYGKSDEYNELQEKIKAISGNTIFNRPELLQPVPPADSINV